ncbi:MAG TPA: CRTAC1 family protein, partial [Acidobacteriota bacterium]|nr:CRTAC1 family protein [Acidobacteriota bacterium]
DRYYGLGVSFGDVDNDGDLDIYVANDATPNLLFVNQGDGTFEEMGLESGLAFNADGTEQASMGVDLADYDNDGLPDVYITHFSDDYSTLYHNEGNLLFKDVTGQSLIMRPEVRFVSWGTAFIDFDLDGWKDIFHANGHVFPYLIGAGQVESFHQPQTLYLNQRNGTFKDFSQSSGPGLEVSKSSRGVAFGDYDNDGDMDMLIANLNDTPTLVRNDLRSKNHWAMFKTVGRTCNREGIGARISVTSGGLTQHWEVKRAKAIYSGSDPRAHFGLGTAKKIEQVVVRWPDGRTQSFENLSADQHYVIDQEAGLRKQSFGVK